MSDLDVQVWVTIVQGWSVLFGAGFLNKMLEVMRRKDA